MQYRFVRIQNLLSNMLWKKILPRKTVTCHLLALESKSSKSYDSRWENIFGFYSSKNDAAVNNLKEDKSEYLLACWLSIVL